jgi:hypothetical protein
MAPGDRRVGRLARALTDLAAWRIAIVVIVLGAFLMWLSASLQEPRGPSGLESTIQEIGALLVVTGTLTVFWDLRGRRALTNEVLAAANLSTDVTESGLTRITTRYLDVEWDALLRQSAHVDLYFAYARTWRHAHATALRALVSRPDTRLRVILPDPTNDALMGTLANKFGCAPDELRDRIAEAQADFENHRRQASEHAVVEVRRTPQLPAYSYYRFDRRSFTVLYAPAPGRTDVPTFETEQGGWLNGFFYKQFDALWELSVRSSGDTST